MQLLISRYLSEAFSSTAYSVNVYVTPGELAIRLTRFTRSEIVNGKGPRIYCSFRRTPRKGKTITKGKQTSMLESGVEGDSDQDGIAGPSNPRTPRLPMRTKHKRHYEEVDEDPEDNDDDENFLDEIRKIDEESSDEEKDHDWEYSIRPTPMQRASNGNDRDSSVIYLSSD